jgi:uncharacterized membrane protein
VVTNPVAIFAVLAFSVAAALWLGKRPGWRLLGSALLVILLAALLANAGVIPSVTEGSPVYDAIFTWVAPLAIFWLLLGVDLRSILAAGGPMLALFLLGALGTVAGVLVAMLLLGDAFGASRAPLAGMFVGTYVGGALNFNAIAIEYDIQRDALTYAGAGVVDNLMTTVWMVVTLAVPRCLAQLRRGTGTATSPAPVGAAPILDDARPATPSPAQIDDSDNDTALLDPAQVALLLGLGALVLEVSTLTTAALADLGVRLPRMLVLTTLGLILAQHRWIRALHGARPLGMFAVLLFLAAIGALCDVGELAATGSLGVDLSILVVVTVLVHGAVMAGGAAVLRIDPAVAAVASQANIGGSVSAVALARGLSRHDLVAPALLVGALGTGIGTYLGFAVAAWLS